MDPLGLISSVRPESAQPLAPAEGAHPSAPSFKETLLNSLDQINRLQQDATQAIEDLSTGRRHDLEGVLIATAKADSAFKMVQAVRNEVIRAYEEIQQMRV